MKIGPLAPMPWDMVVFLSITTVGFGYSVQRVMHPDRSPRLILAMRDKGEAVADNSPLPSQTLNLGCLEDRRERARVTSQDGAIRLKGELCRLDRRRMRGFDGMTVRNLTTGSQGTIFFKGYGSAFVTDYLSLTSGRNVIQVEWKNDSRGSPQMLTAEVFEK